jgi:NAD(P)-dependent dehydrogenase (short-subunit alcohol dehydrogenase family)
MVSKAVIVTGGSAGIGKATVEHLATLGYDVGFTYRTRERDAHALVEQLQRSRRHVTAVQCDLSDPAQATNAVDRLASELGEVYALVNNAGTNRRAAIAEETLDGFAALINVNLASPLFAIQAVLRHMPDPARGGGRIVNVTSILATQPLADASTYCASKAALSMVTRALALELAPRAVTVNEVAPGHVATPMNFGDKEVDAYATPRSGIPAGRPADPHEIAAAIAYFLSPAAQYATGASLLVDGGLALRSGPQHLETSEEFRS